MFPMDERQILLVKVSWSNLYKRPELFEAVLLKQFRNLCPQFNLGSNHKPFKGICHLINLMVLNIHSFQSVFAPLDAEVKIFEERGFDKEVFNSLVLAFLLTLEKIQGNAWNVEIKSAWVMAIASFSYKYSEMLETA